ncbi:MAG: glutamine synthetase [Deltaproteobacteria bacterium]|nr:glutamine synthetase [Candidatus Anaeroferrophillus wilburensis]MBN2887903.1 glutamine synthetase [Deltaproteobacteria bacterium]
MRGQKAQRIKSAFIHRCGLDDHERQQAVEAVIARAKKENLETIRLSFADQHGIFRGKTITVDGLAAALMDGCTITSTLLLKDTSHRTVFPIWTPPGPFGRPQLMGGADVMMVPDPHTFRILPWSPATGWLLCDLYFTDGIAIPFSSRHQGRRAVEALAQAGYRYRAGLEVEFHLFRLVDPHLRCDQAGHPPQPPEVNLLAHGYQYLTELRADELEPVLDLLRRTALELGLPVRSVEVEFGPSQVEFTFHPEEGIGQADNMMIFRNAVKQVCRRQGYHATFMCRPSLPNLFSSGWHLHQSLTDHHSGRNIFVPDNPTEWLSPIGCHYVGGLLRHAAACCVFTTPTVNGYQRYRPYTLAPDRAVWGRENRGAMIRTIGGPGNPDTRIENRIAEPAANPYLAFASQIYAGLDGIQTKTAPGPPSDAPYEAEARLLPRSLSEALQALRADRVITEAMGEEFINYITTIKDAEVDRFMTEISAWEQKEYFEIF